MHVVTRDQRGARGGNFVACKHLERCGLAGTVHTEEAEALALGDAEIEVVDGKLLDSVYLLKCLED